VVEVTDVAAPGVPGGTVVTVANLPFPLKVAVSVIAGPVTTAPPVALNAPLTYAMTLNSDWPLIDHPFSPTMESAPCAGSQFPTQLDDSGTAGGPQIAACPDVVTGPFA
jgi:hypothetical protein